jgi:hypothetical protein
MDPQRFDTLAKTLSTSGTRRGLLRLLAAVPVASGLLTRLEPEDAQGRGEDGRDGKDGKDGRNRGCNPESRSRTCRGKCGPVKNNCGQRINCGSCEICRADSIHCDCPPNTTFRSCESTPPPGELRPLCVCDHGVCDLGPLTDTPSRCCSCTRE